MEKSKINFKSFYNESIGINKFYRVKEIIRDAVETYMKSGDDGLEYSTVLSRKDRDDFLEYLISIEHPLAFADKTIEHKWKDFIRELADKGETVEI